MSLFSSWRVLQENWKLFHRCAIITFSPAWRGVCASETVFPQYRILSILVANIGMSLVTLIWEEFVFNGAGSDTVWPPKRFRKTCQSIFLPWIPLGAHQRSLKNIKLLLSTSIQPNDELAGFMSTFRKKLHTGLRRNVFQNQLDH